MNTLKKGRLCFSEVTPKSTCANKVTPSSIYWGDLGTIWTLSGGLHARAESLINWLFRVPRCEVHQVTPGRFRRLKS